MAFGKLKFNAELMLIAIITFCTANNMEYETVINDNLQDYVVPLHYNVEIQYFLEENLLFGECDIIINITNPLHFIMLHSVPIKVIDAILTDDKNNTVYNLSSASFREKNILILDFDKQLLNATYPDTYTLNITYIRNIRRNKDDFFRFENLAKSKLRYQK